MANKPDPRKNPSNTEGMLKQVHYAPVPFGKKKSLLLDLSSFRMSWSQPPTPAPGGVRMQIWNTPMLDKDGKLIKVGLSDWLTTYAEGVEEKKELAPRHLAHKDVVEATSKDGGVELVEYAHQFFIQTHRGEILGSDKLDRVREIEQIWKAASAGACVVYDLTERDHRTDFESKKSGVKQDRRFEVDGYNIRRILRKANRNFDDKHNRTQGWRMNAGNILIGFLKEAEDEFEHAVILPKWIAECMRETYLQTLIQIVPGWIANYPAPDEWHQDANSTPIPTLPSPPATHFVSCRGFLYALDLTGFRAYIHIPG